MKYFVWVECFCGSNGQDGEERTLTRAQYHARYRNVRGAFTVFVATLYKEI